MPKKLVTDAEERRLMKESDEFDALSIEEIAKLWNQAEPVDIKFVDKRPTRKAAAKSVKKPSRTVRSSR